MEVARAREGEEGEVERLGRGWIERRRNEENSMKEGELSWNKFCSHTDIQYTSWRVVMSVHD